MSLRVLAAPSSDTSHVPTLVLQCDAKKYMFNAGEGTTRVSAQHRASNTRVEHIFLTRIATETLGGIPGLLMTLADGGRTLIDIHAPTNLKYALATTRFYARRDTMSVHAHEIDWQSPQTCFQDDHISVQSVPLLPSSYSATAMDVDEGSESDRPDPPVSGTEAKQWLDAVIRDAWKTQPATAPGQRPSRDPRPLTTPLAHAAHVGESAGRQAAVLCYVVAGHTRRGKFDAVQAAALGIPPGPAFARLSKGEDVDIQRPVQWASMDPQARTQWLRAQKSGKSKRPAADTLPEYKLEKVHIRSDEVVGESRAGPVFFYMHVPTMEHLDALLQVSAQTAFQPYTMASNAHLNEAQRRTPHVIFHAVSLQVWQDPRYEAWRSTFGPQCHHIVATPELCIDALTYTSSALSLLRLSKIDTHAFSVPGYRREPALRDPTALPARANLVVNLQPRGAPASLEPVAPVFDEPLEAMESKAGLPDAPETWDRYCRMAAQARQAPPVPPISAAAGLADHVEFITLGTGSSVPSKYRNVLSTLVHVPNEGYIILDAGESTYYQMARRFGPGRDGWGAPGSGQGIESVLSQLTMLFVSHIHGDHHMGVVRLLLERRKLAPSSPLFLVTNNYTRFYLREYDRLEALGLRDGSVIALDNELLDWQTGIDPDPQSTSAPAKVAGRVRQQWKTLLQRANLTSIRTVQVQHRASHCFGLVLTHQSGWKLVFSGDTMPCQALVRAGQDATVLIHEATMQDDETELAAAKGHSTIGQALQIACDMRASHVLLTHFSQRYPKLARLGTTKADVPPIGIAFDMARMTPAAMRRLMAAHDAMALLLESEPEGEAEEEGEEASAKAPMPASAPADVTSTPELPRKRSCTSRHVQTTFEYRYVVLAFASPHNEAHAPSALSVRIGIEHALQDMHGTIGAGLAVDVLYAGPPTGTPAQRVVGEAVVRVASAYVDQLVNAVSSACGAALDALTGQQPQMRVTVQQVTHNPAMLGSGSRSWMSELLK
ncbi:ribonuclease Z [Malassezia equina]|uniref:ribonuclease Z n=1 Tax=Malassezia equina TaxID=1381935 RepID=A0AAF0ELD7_9BASI|nr:ribonuclease Z [Malassezia equina]